MKKYFVHKQGFQDGTVFVVIENDVVHAVDKNGHAIKCEWHPSSTRVFLKNGYWKEVSELDIKELVPAYLSSPERTFDPFDIVEPKTNYNPTLQLDQFEMQTVLWLILKAGNGEPKCEAIAEKIRNATAN